MTHQTQPDMDSLAVAHSEDLPKGMRRRCQSGDVMIDAVCGRTSVFGLGFAPLREALQSSFPYLQGDSAEMMDGDESDLMEGSEVVEADNQRVLEQDDRLGDTLAARIRQMFAPDDGIGAEHLLLRPSADSAIDAAIGLVRRYRPERSFRTIALVGSDHGRTGMCRSASGRPELHEGFGPMMAGFCHVPPGDVDSLRRVIDEQTACVLISPIDLKRSAVACDADYLADIREICDQHDLLLVIDETQLVVGASGNPLTYPTIADIRADIAILSAGLFAGLPGGLILASAKVTASPLTDLHRFPWQAVAANETLGLMQRLDLPHAPDGESHALAVSIAKAFNGFEFIRDIHATGLTIGIETDLNANDILRVADRSGVRLACAGPNSVRLQPPLVISDEDQRGLLSRLVRAMESLERETAELSI